MSRRFTDQYQLRLPGGLRDQLKAAASGSGRSMNAEIVLRLIASFEPSKDLHPEIARLIDQHIEAEVARRLQEVASKSGEAG